MKLLKLKAEAPAAILKYKGDHEVRSYGSTGHEIYQRWKGHPVEPYNKVLPGYGDEYPWSVPHVPVRLGVPGAAAYSVCALDEFAEPLPARLPKRPSYCGISTGSCSVDVALGY